MAKNSITFVVDVNDKGQIANITAKLDKAGKAADNLGKSTEKVTRKQDGYNRQAKGVAGNTSNSSKAFSKQAQTIKGSLVPAYAVLAANIFALTAAFNFLKRASDLKLLQDSQTQFAASTGTALQVVTTRLQQASLGMLGFREAAEAAAIGVAKGFSPQQLEELAEGATKASVALGRGFQDSFDRLLRGASKAEPELLDELGITLRLKEATENYGRTIGKAADELTNFERSQAVLIETQRQLNDLYGDIEAKANPFVQLSKTFDRLVRTGTQALLPIFEGLANIINRSAKLAVFLFAALGLSIVRNFPIFDNMKQKFADWSKASVARVEEQKAALESYKQKLRDVQAEIDKTQSKASVQAAAVIDDGGTSKLVKKVARNEPLENFERGQLKAAIKRAEAQYTKHGKVVSGIFKGVSQNIFNDFKTSFAGMEVASLTTTQKIKMQFTKLGMGLRVIAAQTKKVWVSTLNAISVAAGKVTKIFGKLLKAASFVGIALLLKEMLTSVQANMLDIITSIATGMDWVGTKFRELGNWLASNFLGIVDSVANGFLEAMRGVANFIEDRFREAFLAVRVMAFTLVNKLNEALDKVGIEGIDTSRWLYTPPELEDLPIQFFKLQDSFRAAGTEFSFFTDQLQGSALQAWAKKIQETTRAWQLSARTLADFEDRVSATQDSIRSISQTFKKQGAAQRGFIKATALSTLGISDLYESLNDDRLNPADKQKALEALNRAMEGLGEIAPAAAEAFASGNIKLGESFEELGRSAVGNFEALKDGVNNFKDAAAGDDLFQIVSILDSLKKNTDGAVDSFTELNSHMSAYEVQEYYDTILKGNMTMREYDTLVRDIIKGQQDLAIARTMETQAVGALGDNLRAVNELRAIELQLLDNKRAYELAESPGEKLRLEALREQLILRQEMAKFETFAALTDDFGGQGFNVAAQIESMAAALERADTAQEKMKVFWQNAGSLVSPMIAQLKTLGPEGEYLGALSEASFAVANAWMSAFDMIQAAGDDMKLKMVGVFSGIAASVNALASVMSAKNAAAVAGVDREIQAEQRRDGKSIASQKKLQQLEKKKEALKKKAFEDDKKMKMAQVVMATALGVMQAFAQGGMFGFITGAIIAAIGAAQLATISSMTYQGGGGAASVGGGAGAATMGSRSNNVDLAASRSPSGEQAYFRGQDGQGTGNATNFVPGGFTGRNTGGNTGFMVGEQGPELFVPQIPGSIVPADETANTGNPVNVNFNISAIDGASVEEMLRTRTGEIIGNIREAANQRGNLFLEDIATAEEITRF